MLQKTAISNKHDDKTWQMRIAVTIEELRQYFLNTETKNLLNRQGSISVLS